MINLKQTGSSTIQLPLIKFLSRFNFRLNIYLEVHFILQNKYKTGLRPVPMTVLRNVEWESTSESVLIDILLCLSGHNKKGAK